MANTYLAMAIDTETFKPRIDNITGGLSGPAIRPITLRMVYQCAKAVKIPVIGLGGIFTAEDAVEYFLAGASAIQVGTANFHDPKAPLHVLDGLAKFLAEAWNVFGAGSRGKNQDMKEKIILVLDVSSREEAMKLVHPLYEHVGMFKVGMQLFTAEGPSLVREIVDLGGKVFLDLKFHDIPNTVTHGVLEAAKLGVSMMTIHAAGGRAMMETVSKELQDKFGEPQANGRCRDGADQFERCGACRSRY